MPTGDAYPSGHLAQSHVGFAYVEFVEINPLTDFPELCTSNIPLYFLDFAWHIYLSKVLTERFSILNNIQTKKDIRLYILTLVLVDINFTFKAKVRIQF